MSGTTVQVTKDNEFTVLQPGTKIGNEPAGLKVNEYTVLTTGQAQGGSAALTKVLIYFVLGGGLPEVWTGNFGTAGYTNPIPAQFGAWSPPST